MSLFISWSGSRARHFAQAVSDFAKSIGVDDNVWISTDIRRGTPWSVELFFQLDAANACILCLTKDSIGSPWLAFEAGAVLGASKGNARIARLSLDASDRELQGGVLERYPLFQCDNASMARMFAHLTDERVAARAEGEDGQAWRSFVSATRTVPALAPRTFDLIVASPGGIMKREVVPVGDGDWDDLLRLFTTVPALALEQSIFPQLRYLDLDDASWVEAPTKISDVRCLRLAVLHPGLDQVWLNEPKIASIQLANSLYKDPKIRTAHAMLRRDLQALALAQEEFKKRAGEYAVSLDELSFYPSFENAIEMKTGSAGWSALAKRPEIDTRLGIRVGDGGGHFQDKPEREAFAADSYHRKMYSLRRRQARDGVE